MNCPVDQRLILEAAAELDPDIYVPILDMLDADTDELEDVDTDGEEPLEQWLTSGSVPVHEVCPCCGHMERNVEWIL